MLGFGKKKQILEEEDLCCRYCEYALEEQEDGQVFCQKKKKQRQGGDRCASFAYDLLKRRPRPMLVQIEDTFDLRDHEED